MFRKILIANRGEIALRIICACKELGIPTVAVYSQADQNSLHVRFADEAVCIGPPPSNDSYLNVLEVISAAEISNADAIHPGYGFLAENAHFAEVCEACGVTFIGPSPEVIRLMGDKDVARKTMSESGLPVMPGCDRVRGPASELEPLCEQIGYPVMIKAAAGGGGKGMRIVHTPSELPALLEIAQSEAQAAFGTPDVYFEKYLPMARHIEFQVLADRHGNAVHLGERECSVQRRYQKLLEEAPSPFLTPEVRERVGALVTRAVRSVNYASAGTLEFLFDGDENFYFMEMNTRIQVEHPVTEMITGLDIVKEQIRLAAGERLRWNQEDITFRGHSIECRINAECPESLRPSPGKITAFHPPGGIGIRMDTAVYPECEVTPYYDSLIAKLISFGANREEAVRRMERALEMTVVEGVKTTIPLHQRILRDENFLAGRLHTRFLDGIVRK